jgi:hypothetical protein
MDFSGDTGGAGDFDLIPQGTLAFATLNFRALTNSKSSDGRYYDVELQIEGPHPFARRKIWTRIGDPYHDGNSEGYRNMGKATFQRILENTHGAHKDDKESYDGKIEDPIKDLSGKKVAIKIKIDEGTGGFSDKNEVMAWLSPNKGHPGYSDYEKLKAGDYGTAEANQKFKGGGGTSGFGAQKAPQGAASGFGRAKESGADADKKPAWMDETPPDNEIPF